MIENTYNLKFYILFLVRIISWNALITTNTLLIHCTKTICLTYSLNGQFTNANGAKERIYPHSFSVYGEGERRSRILASFKIAYIVGVVRKRFFGVCGDVSMAMGVNVGIKMIFCIPQNGNKNNSNFLNLRFQTKKPSFYLFSQMQKYVKV